MELIASFFVKLFAEARWLRFYKRVEIILPDGSKMSWKQKRRADRWGEWQARLRRNYGAETAGGLCGIEFFADGSEPPARVSTLPSRKPEGR